MANVTGLITLERLAKDFTSLFQRRVFRLEALDYYDAANEREPYTAFLAGQPADPAWRRPWQGLVRGVRESGRTMERVHIVSEPVTDYIRFSLLHGYPASVEAGEEVRILGLAAASEAGLRRDDFWLFDDDLAALLAYDGDGRVERISLTNEPVTLALFCGTRERSLRLARPLAQYVADHKITGKGPVQHEHRMGWRAVPQGRRQ
jgi:hypothetical protein